jgi:fructosamine-3-kinase
MASGAEVLRAEAIGLRELERCCGVIRIPRVIAAGNSTEDQSGYLLMEWIEPGVPGSHFWKTLGEGLAELHAVGGETFGFTSDNFIGATLQINTPCADWSEFFATCRLEPQFRLARDRKLWSDSWAEPLRRLMASLPEALSGEYTPSLVHGDLWRGNTMPAADGQPVLIDPAVYFGHAEVDIAMSELFGRFGAEFYDAYRAARGLPPGYSRRRDIYNLYHLVNHLNLFGGSYATSVSTALHRLA